jgi:hypothetical protein
VVSFYQHGSVAHKSTLWSAPARRRFLPLATHSTYGLKATLKAAPEPPTRQNRLTRNSTKFSLRFTKRGLCQLETLIGENTLKRILVCLLTLMIVTPVTLSQTKKRSTRTASAPARKSPGKSPVVQAGAIRVADQLKTLTRFLYLLGGVAKGIEAADAAARRNEASPAVIEQTNQSKATVKNSLQNVRVGLDKLEVDFRSNPELNRYYIKLAGVASGAATAEQQAASDQFDRAGRTMLDVVSRLADVLLEMSQ